MAQEIKLAQQANQSISMIYGDNRYDIEVVQLGKTMGVSIAVNGEQLVTGMRALPNTPLLPYDYLAQKAGGNFMFRIQDGSYPWWENFGVSQPLVFADLAEIQSQIDALPDPLTQLGQVRTPYPRNTVDVLNALIATGYVGDPRTAFSLTYQNATVTDVLRVDGLYRDAGGIEGKDMLYPNARTSLVYPTSPDINTLLNWHGTTTPATSVLLALNQPDPFGGTTATKVTCDATASASNVLIGLRFPFSGLPTDRPHSAGWFVRGDAGGEMATIGLLNTQGAQGGQLTEILTTSWVRRKVSNFVAANGANEFDVFIFVPAGVAQSLYICRANLVQEPIMGVSLENPGFNPVTVPANYSRNGAQIVIANPLVDKEKLMWSGQAVVNF